VDPLWVTFAAAEHYLGSVYDYASLGAELAVRASCASRTAGAGGSDDPAFRNLERHSARRGQPPR
jgi:hypothetical protein